MTDANEIGEVFGSIEGSEARARNDLAEAEIIPRTVTLPNVKALEPGPTLPHQKPFAETLEHLGFKLGPPLEDELCDDGEPLLLAAELPDGWSKRHHPNDHRRVILEDDQGHPRAIEFIKAVSYDPKARIRFRRPFELKTPPFEADLVQVKLVARAWGSTVFASEQFEGHDRFGDLEDGLLSWVAKRLDHELPQWRSVTFGWTASDVCEAKRLFRREEPPIDRILDDTD